MSVRIRESVTGVDENVMMSQLINVVSDVLGVSNFVNERPGTVFSFRTTRTEILRC